MKFIPSTHYASFQSRQIFAFMLVSLVALGAMALPGAAFAEGFEETGQKVCGFFDNINKILNLASIAAVTVAVAFSGYQIAFAHKRITDVAPVLIGGVLIGAGGQIAKMLVGDSGSQSCQTASMALYYLSNFYA